MYFGATYCYIYDSYMDSSCNAVSDRMSSLKLCHSEIWSTFASWHKYRSHGRLHQRVAVRSAETSAGASVLRLKKPETVEHNVQRFTVFSAAVVCFDCVCLISADQWNILLWSQNFPVFFLFETSL